ncbi:MAG: hypothetical protein J5745_00555 [Bacteroidales bacterium]|nr:hypothetical protein [Bacteroidales bacterium]
MSLRDRIKIRFGGRERELAFFAFSLLMAIVIWFLTNLSKDYSGTLSVPVTAECSIDGHSNRSSNTAVVSARCRTDGFKLVHERSLRDKKPVVVKFDKADLRRTGPDTWSIFGSAKNSYINQMFGEGISLEAFITDTLSFVFKPERHKKVPVEVPLSLQCKSQYMQSGPFRAVPDSVTIYGEESRLQAIEKVTTPRLSFTDAKESLHGVVKINRPAGVRVSVEEVAYELPVSRYVELRGTFPVEVWNAPVGHEVQVYPPTASVILRCAFPLAKDPMASFKVFIDYKDFAESMSGKCVPRTLKQSSGVLDCRIEPEVFDCIEVL